MCNKFITQMKKICMFNITLCVCVCVLNVLTKCYKRYENKYIYIVLLFWLIKLLNTYSNARFRLYF